MSITLSDAGGFSDGDAIQLAQKGAYSIVTSPASWASGERGILLSWNIGITDSETPSVTPGSQWMTHSINVRFNNLTSDTIFFFLGAKTVGFGGGTSWFLTYENGDVILNDTDGADVGVVVSGISVDTWYRVTVKWKLDNSSDVRVWWDESGSYHGAVKLSASGVDCFNGTGTAVGLRIFNGVNQATGGVYQYFGAWTVRLDDGDTITSNDTIQTPVYQKQYRHDITTAAPNIGPNLSSGTWDDADELPLGTTNYVMYSATDPEDPPNDGVVTSDDATAGGPAGDTEAAGKTWLRAYWAWTWKVATGFGGTNTWVGNYGASSAPNSDGTTETSLKIGTGAWVNAIEQQWSSGSQFPASDEYMQQGFKVGNVKDGYVADMWCGLVVEYAALSETLWIKGGWIKGGLLAGL